MSSVENSIIHYNCVRSCKNKKGNISNKYQNLWKEKIK